MAQPSDSLQRAQGYFHAGSKTLTKEGQYPFESPYAAGHIMQSVDILAQEIPYFADQAALDAFMANPATAGVIKKYDQVDLVQVKSATTGYPTTDEQSWYIEDNGEWVKPILNGTLAPDPTTNNPASVLDPVLYRSDGSQVPSTMGVWWIDPFQGLLRFGDGYEPSNSTQYGGTAIGTPKVTCYAYTGKKLLDVLGESVENRDYVYESSAASQTHTVTHNLGTTSLNCTVFESNGSGGWVEIMVNPEHTDDNNTTIQLTESVDIKATFRKIG